MKAYTFTQEELTIQYNDVIDAYTSQLRDAGVISQEMFDELSQYRIVASQPTVFGRIWAKLFLPGWKADQVYYHLVKVIVPKQVKKTEEVEV